MVEPPTLDITPFFLLQQRHMVPQDLLKNCFTQGWLGHKKSMKLYCVIFDRDFYYLQVIPARRCRILRCSSSNGTAYAVAFRRHTGEAVVSFQEGWTAGDESKLLKMKPEVRPSLIISLVVPKRHILQELGARHIFCFDGCTITFVPPSWPWAASNHGSFLPDVMYRNVDFFMPQQGGRPERLRFPHQEDQLGYV